MDNRKIWRERRAAIEAGRWRMSVLGPRRRVRWTPIVDSVGRMACAAGLAKLTRRTIAFPVLTELEVPCVGLPQDCDGFLILHLSDLHLENMPELVDSVGEHIARLKADIVVFTGDYEIGVDSGAERFAELIHPVLADVPRDRMFGVLGNHDSLHAVEPLERAGIRMLLNEHVTVQHGAAELHLVGVDDPHAFYTENANQALTAAPDGFRILLAHTPDLASAAAAAGFHLYLTGHTHGGQICLPGGRPVLTALDTHRHLASGRWRIETMQGYTNRGIGTAAFPLRINCPPEIALLRLRCAD